MAESKYAARLRELGCEPWKELLSGEDYADVDRAVEALVGTPVHKYPRKQRRQMLADGTVPYFVYAGDCLNILDETFTDWRGPLEAAAALEGELGFNNLGKKLRPPVPRHKIN